LSLPKIELEKKPNTLDKPTGSLSESTLSIKAQLAAHRMKKVVAEEDLPRNQFSTDALISCTRKYAHILKDLGKETFYHALIKRDPKLTDETITLIVDNEVQIAYITPLLTEFVEFLKTELKNGFLDVKLLVTEQIESEQKPTTGKEKYQALARRNPNIHTLKNRFNLDIEF
jgi:DNA polymerase-3 subunit gamma/tau